MKELVQAKGMGSRESSSESAQGHKSFFRAEATLFAVIILVSLLVLVAVMGYYRNVNRATTNGLWKSVPMQKWVDWAPDRYADPANLIYYPVYGFLIRYLPEQVFGPTWRRMALVNAAFAAVALGFIFLIARNLFDSRTIGLYATIFQLSCGFFLLLATINEDIMPGYACFVVATALLVFYARRKSWLTLALAAQFLALSWLFQSFLMYPAVPAACFALFGLGGGIGEKFRRLAGFAAFLLPLPIVCARLAGLGWEAGFWTSKGLGSGWGGFSFNKLIFMWGGISEYFVGGLNITTTDVLVAPEKIITAAAKWILIVGLLWLAGKRARSNWHRAEWRLASLFLFGCFALGEGMNLFIQPQDPQMQIQPMTGLFLGWACFGAWVLHTSRLKAPSFLRHAFLSGCLAVLFYQNLHAYDSKRHLDDLALANVKRLEAVADPKTVVFVAHGFEGLNTWLTASWGAGATLPSEPAAKWENTRNYKVVYVCYEAVLFPRRPAEESARNVVRIIDEALDSGYQVVATDVVQKTREEMITSFSTISTAEKPAAIYDALHQNFETSVLTSIPEWGDFYRITRAGKTAAPPGSPNQ